METKEKRPTKTVPAVTNRKKPVKRVESDREAIRENRKKLLTRKSCQRRGRTSPICGNL